MLVVTHRFSPFGGLTVSQGIEEIFEIYFYLLFVNKNLIKIAQNLPCPQSKSSPEINDLYFNLGYSMTDINYSFGYNQKNLKIIRPVVKVLEAVVVIMMVVVVKKAKLQLQKIFS